MAALRRAHREGVEVALVTGRRHAFAMPIARQLGFDFWLMSSNGASHPFPGWGDFHCDMLPADTCQKLCAEMKEFRGNLVLTFDTEAKGAIVLERLDDLSASIQKWLEKNAEFIDFVIPVEDALTRDPVQAMFLRQHWPDEASDGGTIEDQRIAEPKITVLRTEYPARDLLMIDVLNRDCSKGHAVERWAKHRGIPRDQVMAIGDNYNDIEMLAFAGVAFIMGNAAPDMHRDGWKVTRSNAENGVAAAIEQVLGPSQSDG